VPVRSNSYLLTIFTASLLLASKEKKVRKLEKGTTHFKNYDYEVKTFDISPLAELVRSKSSPLHISIQCKRDPQGPEVLCFKPRESECV